ncbi:MAG TPA: DUF6580 family putative transport protein [Acidobacteriota bacterium]|nr:DUF6580 family putative transport protein [Acidobacteriota bacterium]
MKPRTQLLLGMIFAAAAMRLLPHPSNFTPIGALALFAGANFDDKRWAFIVPLAAMLLSDLVIGFHSEMPLIYGAFAVMVVMGFWLREKKRAAHIVGASVAAALFFFIVSNFGVWVFDGLYPLTFQGLVICYVAAVPFFQNWLIATLFYSAILFGGFALAEKKLPVLSAVHS